MQLFVLSFLKSIVNHERIKNRLIVDKSTICRCLLKLQADQDQLSPLGTIAVS